METCYFGYFRYDCPCPWKLIASTCRKVWCLATCKKINFIPPIFLEILLRCWKRVILGGLDMPGYGQQKWWYQLVENFGKFISHLFLEILLRYWKLVALGTLNMPGPAHQNNIVDLWKTLTFNHMQKTNLIPSFFLEIFHFKKSCNLIRAFWLRTWETGFFLRRGLPRIVNNNIILHFRLFPGITTTTFLKYFSKFKILFLPFFSFEKKTYKRILSNTVFRW